METVNVLWTGGFDSTYRICQLSFYEINIQPYYISAEKRAEPNELKAMAEISAYIEAQKTTRCLLLPIIVVSLNEIPPYPDIEASWRKLFESVQLGSQYAWFARFAREKELFLELGYEAPTPGRISHDVRYLGKIREVTISLLGNEEFQYAEFEKENSLDDLVNVFERMRFGIPLFYMTKLQTVEAYKELGYGAVIQMTWFCAHPINGKPCGLCNPCKAAIEKGMGHRLPWWSRLFYFLLKRNYMGRWVDRQLKSVYNKNFREKVH